MTKKQFLIQILTALQDDRMPAGGIRVLVEQDALDDGDIQRMITVFETLVKEEKDEHLQAKFATSATALKKLQELEADETSKDHLEKELEVMLQDI